MIIYIMVTHWRTHWKGIERTYYTSNVIYFSLKEIQEGVTTIFVKRNERNKEIEHILKGTISGIEIQGKEGKEVIHFNVNIEREISIDEFKREFFYIKIPEESGWYKYEIIPVKLCPPFFRDLKETTSDEEFEDKVYLLLKLLGITTIHKYPRKRQAGLPDGIFKINNLAVIYDATLFSDIRSKKEQQIENYINMLKSDRINIRGKKEEVWEISRFFKEVWIITNELKSEEYREISGIKVKIVSIDSLINLYIKRLQEIDREEELVEFLRKIEIL
ncbi:MAG: hypothetical protein ABIM83_06740 [candidate division WOR-3 bacterium]